jgi:hypothetical protein
VLPEAATRKRKVVRRRREDKTVSEQEAAEASTKTGIFERPSWASAARLRAQNGFRIDWIPGCAGIPAYDMQGQAGGVKLGGGIFQAWRVKKRWESAIILLDILV